MKKTSTTQGDVQLVEYLLSRGANVNCGTSRITCLHVAAMSGFGMLYASNGYAAVLPPIGHTLRTSACEPSTSTLGSRDASSMIEITHSPNGILTHKAQSMLARKKQPHKTLRYAN